MSILRSYSLMVCLLFGKSYSPLIILNLVSQGSEVVHFIRKIKFSPNLWSVSTCIVVFYCLFTSPGAVCDLC